MAQICEAKVIRKFPVVSALCEIHRLGLLYLSECLTHIDTQAGFTACATVTAGQFVVSPFLPDRLWPVSSGHALTREKTNRTSRGWKELVVADGLQLGTFRVFSGSVVSGGSHNEKLLCF